MTKRLKTVSSENETIEASPVPSIEFKMIEVNRISRTVAGGRRLRFRALVVGGDRAGRIGLGIAKGNDVNTAVKKATEQARKNIHSIPITNGTIAHAIRHCHGSTTVYLKPTRPGSSVVAGGSARAIFELAGIRNISCKIVGSTNKINVGYTTLAALDRLSKSLSYDV